LCSVVKRDGDGPVNEVWERLTPQARDRVDAALLDRGLLLAIVALRGECELDWWRAVNVPHLVALVRAGATFVDGHVVDGRPRRLAA
jgi:hypothetical protein